MPDENTDNLSVHTTEIVSAYVARNQINPSDIPMLIKDVHTALSGLGQATTLPAEPLKPAVNPRKSVFPDYLICLEDGKKLKMLRRHLRSTYGLMPDEYRKKWNLPSDYPMVAPNYSESRSKLAKQLGLGTSGSRRQQPAPAPAAPARRGRRKTGEATAA